MPNVFIQIGQAGNQVGNQLWQALPSKDSLNFSNDFYYTSNHAQRRARGLIVDTEPKVVKGILTSDGGGLFEHASCIIDQGGRGNNWAFGYSRGSQTTTANRGGIAQTFSDISLDEDASSTQVLAIMRSIRRQAEASDRTPDFLMLHSLAGGTGSGLGSRVLEELRFEYPLAYIATASVAPRSAGDTALQSINATLALSFVHTYADVALMYHNDHILDLLSKTRSGSSSSSSSSSIGGSGGVGSQGKMPQGARSMLVVGDGAFADVNAYIARSLLGLLWPMGGEDLAGGGSRIRDLVQSAAPDTAMKFVEARVAAVHSNTPTTSLWSESLKQLGREFVRHHAADGEGLERPVTSSSTLLLARSFPEAAIADLKAAQKAAESKLFAAPLGLQTSGLATTTIRASKHSMPMTPTSRLGAASSRARGSTAAPTLAAVSNRSSVVPFLGSCVEGALAMCQAGAYMHWYERYGCSRQAIAEAAHAVADIAEHYSDFHMLPSMWSDSLGGSGEV